MNLFLCRYKEHELCYRYNDETYSLFLCDKIEIDEELTLVVDMKRLIPLLSSELVCLTTDKGKFLISTEEDRLILWSSLNEDHKIVSFEPVNIPDIDKPLENNMLAILEVTNFNHTIMRRLLVNEGSSLKDVFRDRIEYRALPGTNMIKEEYLKLLEILYFG